MDADVTQDSEGPAIGVAETPYFSMRIDLVEAQVRAFTSAFGPKSVHYAMKANSDPGVIRAVEAAGGGFEIASVYELRQLQQLGVAPQNIIFGTSVKPAAAIEEASLAGVALFACDSREELEKLAIWAQARRCTFESPSTTAAVSSECQTNSVRRRPRS